MISDVNACETEGVCDQQCSPLPKNKYACSCVNGYILKGKSYCAAQNGKQFFMYKYY